jgi:hypothetical protein
LNHKHARTVGNRELADDHHGDNNRRVVDLIEWQCGAKSLVQTNHLKRRIISNMFPQSASSCVLRVGSSASGRSRFHAISRTLAPSIANLGDRRRELHVTENFNGIGYRMASGRVAFRGVDSNNNSVATFSTKAAAKAVAAATKVSYFERKKLDKAKRTQE